MEKQKKAPVVDAQFDGMVAQLQTRLKALLEEKGARLYTTDAHNLFQLYLAGFRDDIVVQQHHNCNACQSFIERYGSLAVVTEEGQVVPAMWSSLVVPAKYQAAVFNMQQAVERAQVTGIFYADKPVLGHPETNGWTHFAVALPMEYLKLVPVPFSADQHSAAKRDDRENVLRAMIDYDTKLLDQAVAILEADALTRSEKFLGPAKWLAGLGHMIDEVKDQATRNRLLWRSIALAPAGFCHPRAGMLGTLYEDLRLELPFDQVKQRFAEKMHPLQYQRPSAAPKAGAIDAAEKLAAQLGIVNSLKRRLLRLDEVDALWRPGDPPKAADGGGVFDHLRAEPKREAELQIDAGKMTWEKFQRTLLPKARAMEVYVGYDPQPFVAFTTAVDPAAPPLFQWDRPERRNPAAWYMYVYGASAERFNLVPDCWNKVEAIAERPNKWRGSTGFEHLGEGVIFCLEDCKDTKPEEAGLGLFPEVLRNELHGVRAVIEAHSRTGKLEPAGGAEAAGWCLEKNAKDVGLRVRVTDEAGNRTEVELDRWD